MRYFILLSMFILFHALVFGQSTVVIKVVDANDEKPIEFATVTVVTIKDSTIVSGAVTDSTGIAAIQNIPFGAYFMKISFIGYKTFFIHEINLDSPQFDAGIIRLISNGQLNEIEVQTNAAIFENKIDKKVFNVQENLTTKGGTGLDVLRQVPSITVDENDNILLRGDGNVTVLIDGRPSSMAPNLLLKQMPASAIEKVEIITNPSAKYDPEGVSGIINVILVKNKSTGFNGAIDLNSGYGKFLKTNNTLSLNYRNDKINITTSNSIYYGNTWFGGDLERNVLLADSTWDRLRSDDYGQRENTFFTSRLGLDYFVNDKNVLYLMADYNYGQNYGERLMNYYNYDDNNALINNSQRNGNITAPSHNISINTGWQKTFSKSDHTLYIDLNLSALTFVGDEWLWHKYFDLSNTNYQTLFQHTLDATNNKTGLFKIDYVLPINDSTIFEAGVHLMYRQADNEFLFEFADDNQNYIYDSTKSNHFIYNQFTVAPYLTFAKQIKKFGFKAGLRAEPTYTYSELLNTQEDYTLNYIQLFPSAHLSYNINDYTVMQLSYSRRINRPELDQLNPFTNYSDNLTLETGNPFLKPEIIHVTELSFLKFWKKANISATGYVRQINDLIRRELFFDGIYTHITNTNLGKSYLSGGDLILTYMPVKGMRLMLSANVWNTSTNDPHVSQSSWQHYTGFYTSLMGSYTMKKGWSAQIWASYAPKMKVIQGVIRENYGGGLSLQKNILKDNGQLSVTVYDVLKSRWFAFESTDLGNYNLNSYRYWESRSVYLSFTYSFGKIVQGKQRKINDSGDISDDKDVPISN